MNRIQESVFILILVVVPVLLICVMILVRFPWYAVVGGVGFSFSTGSWFAIHRLVRRELPHHPLANANYMNPGIRIWNVGIRLPIFYVRQYGLDVRSGLLLTGVVLLVVPVVTNNLQAVMAMLKE